MTIAADYSTAKTSLNTLITNAKTSLGTLDATVSTSSTALKIATLSLLIAHAQNALAQIEGGMADERQGNLLTTLGL